MLTVSTETGARNEDPSDELSDWGKKELRGRHRRRRLVGFELNYAEQIAGQAQILTGHVYTQGPVRDWIFK